MNNCCLTVRRKYFHLSKGIRVRLGLLARLLFVAFCSTVATAFVSDTGSHPPPATGQYTYNSFIPALPPNSSYVDPVFGSTVNRLTGDGSHDDIYARNMWWNADGTLYLHRSQSGGTDRWQVINATTGAIEYDNIPFGYFAADGGFDPVNPNVLYYLIADDGTGHGEIIRVTLEGSDQWTADTYFTAPAPIESLGGTLNWMDANGQYMVVRYGPEPSVYVYKTSDLSAPYANPLDASNYVDLGGYIGITPDGQYLVGWNESSGTGVAGSGQGMSWRLDNVNDTIATSPTPFWSLCGDHGDFLSATDGNDYMITYDCDTQPGLWRVDITNNASGLDESQQQALPNNELLVAFQTWNDFGHISACARCDWAYFATEDLSDTFNSGTDNGSGYITPWHAFRQEIDAVNVVTGSLRRLAHNRSRYKSSSPYDYYSFPRVSASWGGNYVGFASNFNQVDANGAPIVDIYDIPFSAYATGPQPVLWADQQNVTVNGSSLQKTAGCDGCSDAGAVALQHISTLDGYVEFTTTETAGERWVGLSQSFSYTSAPDFALRLQNGDAEVREGGIYEADTPFVPGDVFRITVQSGTITYSKNGTAFYSHSVAIPYSQLLVGAILQSLNSTVANVMVSGAS